MAGGRWSSFCGAVRGRKSFEPGRLEDGNLRRCLSYWDLTALGVGSTLGAGVYILIGYVALHVAGPSIVLSFLIAAVAAMFAGLCYAEFGVRVPRAGSAYIYAYVSVGELIAFIIGWCNILEAAFGTASLARGLSMYVDSMSNNSMSAWFTATTPIASPLISPYFDLFAFFTVILIGVLLAVGVRELSTVNNVFVAINLVVIVFVVIAGAVAADWSNWYIPSTDVPENHGSGGFFPYGVWGTMQGAAICFYGFVGFDTISAASEEVYKPRRAVPFTILTVLFVAFVCYASVSIVITMMMPYYQHDTLASVATAFTFVGWDWAKWVVSVGAVLGILTSLFGAMFPLPRLLYAMSTDGLLFSFFAKLTPDRKSPAFATLLPAALIAILAGIVELEQLIMMLCIGTLVSYTIVAIGVIVLRYHSDYAPRSSPGVMKELFGRGFRLATRSTTRIIDFALVLFICLCVSMALVTTRVERPLIPGVILHAIALFLVVIMALQPKIKEELSFKTPLVPLIPCLSIYVNIHLMVLIKPQTWLYVGIWIVIGIPIYIICICCCKRKKDKLEESVTTLPEVNRNGKAPIQIVVESPTPPDTMNRISNYGGHHVIQEDIEIKDEEEIVGSNPNKTAEISIHQAYVENNEEKEAKIIDLLDKVLQAEEDSYGEVISLKDQKEEGEVSTVQQNVVHRKSLSELSDAGSDASMGNQVLSKYDVIAQVHREDLPKVNEEEERRDDEDIYQDEIDDHEQVTAFNDSETNSRTDESGYSDTIDRNALSESMEEKEDAPIIPVPPPLDENYFRSPYFKKSYTISSKPTKKEKEEEENKPRESVQSNGSQSEDNITFGSDRQIHFMSKLNNIFQNKMSANSEDDEEPRKRSHSTGNVTENAKMSISHVRPSLASDLRKEILSIAAVQNLRPVTEANNKKEVEVEDEQVEEDTSMSREDLKSKLENIFASGGPQLLKPRLMKSNPPTPEEAYQTDTSSTESIAKLPIKIGKKDTLKRQKDKFGEVLNSFRLSFNKDDDV